MVEFKKLNFRNRSSNKNLITVLYIMTVRGKIMVIIHRKYSKHKTHNWLVD